MINVKKGQIEVNGAQLYYEEAGTGFPLVLVHAGIADHRMWDGQFAAFAEHYRTIRYDLRGFGQSQKPNGPFSHRADLYQLLHSLGVEKAFFVACSMGGRTSLDFTLEHPELAAGLVLVGSGLSGYEYPGKTPPAYAAIEAAEKQGDIELVNELEVRLWVDGASRRPDQVDPAVRQMVLEMNRIALATPEGAGADQPLNPPGIERLRSISVPVLIIYGDLDQPPVRDIAKVLSHELRQSKTVVMSGTAHVPMMERPQEFSQIVLSFLEGISEQA